uniref:C2H2-type domain-containing protein n=1 Tax=Oryza nivara TaxID=4536 RepID=A0A0E0G540_ORYNI
MAQQHSPPPPPAPPSPPPALPCDPMPPPPRHDDTTLTLSLAPPAAARPLQAMVARAKCSSPTGDAPPCTECGRQFLSWKALFGHMRCHPERHWRGITPPGGGGAGAASSTAASQFTLREREVAASLLMLSGAHPARSGAGKGKGKKRLLAPAAAAAPHHSPATCADHKCAVCHRGFATGQALGGHKRCHWPDRSCADQAISMLAVSTAGSSSTTTTSASPPPAPATAATALDLNLNLPPPLARKNLQDGGSNETLDLNLGLQS